MKRNVCGTAVLALCLLLLASAALAQGNYEIVIDGKTQEIELGNQYSGQTASGGNFSFTVRKKAQMTYADDLLSFDHPGDKVVTESRLDKDLVQLMCNSANGSLYMIQEYTSMDPSMLVPLMLNELVKEQVNYGYSIDKQQTTRTTANGKKLSGTRATARYNSEEMYYEVLSYGSKDRGLILVSAIDKSFLEQDQAFLDLMWNTLKINF
ncbi:MAG: hypothetical protein V3573_10865 [Desulfovibrionaceae bacterium]